MNRLMLCSWCDGKVIDFQEAEVVSTVSDILMVYLYQILQGNQVKLEEAMMYLIPLFYEFLVPGQIGGQIGGYRRKPPIPWNVGSWLV